MQAEVIWSLCNGDSQENSLSRQGKPHAFWSLGIFVDLLSHLGEFLEKWFVLSSNTISGSIIVSIETPVGSVVNILENTIDTSHEAALGFAISNYGFVA